MTKRYGRPGEKTWRLTVALDDGDEPQATTVVFAEYPPRSVGLAKARAVRELAKLTNPTEPSQLGNQGYYWAAVELGVYEDDSIDDPDHGLIPDVTWEPTTDRNGIQIAWYAYLRDDGTVYWRDPDWSQAAG